MKSYSSREVIQILRADGWYEVGCDGDHRQFKHLTKSGRSNRDAPKEHNTCGNIETYRKAVGRKIQIMF